MTFGEHLDELRRRLMKGILAFAVAFAAAFAFQEELLRYCARPYESARASINVDLTAKWIARPKSEEARAVDRVVALLAKKGVFDEADLKELAPSIERERRLSAPHLDTLQATGALEQFNAYMLICLLAALVVSGPMLIFQLWQFVAEGLYDTERRTVMRVLPVSLALFFVGLAFGYGVMAEMSVRFLIGYGDIEIIRPQVTVSSYLGLLFLLLLVMGLVFQIPLVMTVLASTGLVGPDFYRGKRRHCVLAIFLIAAIITPPDYVSQLLVAGPMWILFEIGIVLAKWATRRRSRRRDPPNPPKPAATP